MTSETIFATPQIGRKIAISRILTVLAVERMITFRDIDALIA
jgi:hypothetical protein